MTTLEYNSLLNNPDKIQPQQTVALKTIIEKYPYFQSARTLYLKGLKKQDSFKYNNELKITAAYTTDRTVLFDFITSDSKLSDKKEVAEQVVKSNFKKENLKELKETLHIGKPIAFNRNETYSFNEWLQLASKKPIRRTPKKEDISLKKETIIDRFLQKRPKISKIQKKNTPTILVSDIKQDSSLMTETLAKVYLEQKKFDNAIQAYRILSLKYPEKSGFFADQIKRVQILQNNKS